MRGRKPIPDSVKRLRGTGGLRKPQAPPQASDVPPPFEFLDAGAKVEWSRVAPLLVSLDCLQEVDLMAFGSYCQCVSQWQQASVELAKAGSLMSEGSQGQPRVHPLCAYLDLLQKQLRAFAAEFGFTPSARMRIEVPPPSDEDDEMEAFLNG